MKRKKLLAVILSCAMAATSAVPVLGNDADSILNEAEESTPTEPGDMVDLPTSIPESQTIYLFPGDPLTMDATVPGETDVTYEWYMQVGEESVKMEGESGSVCSVEQPESNLYSCAISVGNIQWTTVIFSVIYNTGLYACANEYSTLMREGETQELSVYASLDEGNFDKTINYQWYIQKEVQEDGGNIRTDFQPIDGETDAVYTVTETAKDEVYVCICSDQYGNSYWSNFYITYDIGIRTKAETYLYVIPGDPAAMKVNASSDYGYELTYQWYQIEYTGIEDEDGMTQEKATLIEGAQESAYTVDNVQKNEMYRCVITDEKGDSCWLDFYIELELGLKISNYHEREIVFAGNELTLSMEAIAEVPEAEISYQWKKLSGFDEYTGQVWSTIEGATDSSLTVVPEEKTTYACAITVVYNGTVIEERSGQIIVNVIQDGDVITTLPEAGDDGNICFDISFENLDDVAVYEWKPENTRMYEFYVYQGAAYFADETGKPLLDADNGWVTSAILEKGKTYYLVAFSDDDSCSFTGSLDIRIETGLRIEGYEEELQLSKDNKAVLNVSAKVYDWAELSYQWYELVSDEGKEEWKPLKDAIANTYVAAEAGKYKCTLTITEDEEVLDDFSCCFFPKFFY